MLWFHYSPPLKNKKKEIHSLPLAFPLSFSSLQACLLTPTPFFSALFKSKQKTHLVCLLPPFSPLLLSFSLTPSLFLLWLFYYSFYRHKSSTLSLLLLVGEGALLEGQPLNLRLLLESNSLATVSHNLVYTNRSATVDFCRLFCVMYSNMVSDEFKNSLINIPLVMSQTCLYTVNSF